MQSLSILIPAYQEERTIDQVLDAVLAIDIKSLGFQKEIIVCDDGSDDATFDIVKAKADAHPSVKAIRHPQNRGKGAAIRSALEHATGDYALVQDADLEYDVEDYPALLAPLSDAVPVVYGSRFLYASRPDQMKGANFIGNRVLTMAANLLYGLSITDEATCFKVFDTELLRSLELTCEGFEFCPEVTAKLGLKKVPIVEVPIRYSARAVEEGKKVRWTDGAHALWVLCKHRVLNR